AVARERAAVVDADDDAAAVVEVGHAEARAEGERAVGGRVGGGVERLAAGGRPPAELVAVVARLAGADGAAGLGRRGRTRRASGTAGGVRRGGHRGALRLRTPVARASGLRHLTGGRGEADRPAEPHEDDHEGAEVADAVPSGGG